MSHREGWAAAAAVTAVACSVGENGAGRPLAQISGAATSFTMGWPTSQMNVIKVTQQETIVLVSLIQWLKPTQFLRYFATAAPSHVNVGAQPRLHWRQPPLALALGSVGSGARPRRSWR